jgi:hypothetical protein
VADLNATADIFGLALNDRESTIRGMRNFNVPSLDEKNQRQRTKGRYF